MNALLGEGHVAKSEHRAERGSVRLLVHSFVNVYPTLVRAIVSRDAEFILGGGVFRILEPTRITAIEKFVRREFYQLYCHKSPYSGTEL